MSDQTHCGYCGRDWEDCDMQPDGDWLWNDYWQESTCLDCWRKGMAIQSIHESIDLLAAAVTDWPNTETALADYVKETKDFVHNTLC